MWGELTYLCHICLTTHKETMYFHRFPRTPRRWSTPSPPFQYNNVIIKRNVILTLAALSLLKHMTLRWRPNQPDGVSLAIVYSTVYSGADQRKHQSSASLAFVRGIRRSPVNSPYKGPVTREMFLFDDVIVRLSKRQPSTLSVKAKQLRTQSFYFSESL